MWIIYTSIINMYICDTCVTYTYNMCIIYVIYNITHIHIVYIHITHTHTHCPCSSRVGFLMSPVALKVQELCVDLVSISLFAALFH